MDLSEDELDTAMERCNDLLQSLERMLILFLGTQLLFVSGLLVGFMWAFVELVPYMVITHVRAHPLRLYCSCLTLRVCSMR